MKIVRIYPVIFLCLAIAMFLAHHTVVAKPASVFEILVVDEETGRGVPLVELRTVNDVRYYTDSNGIAAIDDIDMVGQKVYFTVSSPGYSFPKDAFGYSGVAVDVNPGSQFTIKMKRTNVAERLYRITGAGIYRDSIMLGLPVPIKHPLIDGLVFGQDTVEVTPYRNKLYWFFGDTSKPSYPLGQFATSGATSELPSHGGLDPDVGVDLTYWIGADGFSRPMIPIADAPGPVWIGGLFTMKDKGEDHLFSHFVEINHDGSTAASGLAEFDDSKAAFQPLYKYTVDSLLHPEGEPFHVYENGVDRLYFDSQQTSTFPLLRNVPDLAHITDPTTYEGFTCLVAGTKFAGSSTSLERDLAGHLVWSWKKDTEPLGDDDLNKLVDAGKLASNEIPYQLRDIETGEPLKSDGGSVFWNSYRKRWIMITTQSFGSESFLGEVWFAEADTPVGPWTYARKVASHDHYTFYNPTQHPFFDQDGGRTIYFEGTYTDTYSGVKDVIPRYNYNQLMYRLRLDDARLALPSPVYFVRNSTGVMTYEMRDDVERTNTWTSIQSVPFYALAPSGPHPNSIPVFQNMPGQLSLSPGSPQATPIFYALAADNGGAMQPSIVVPLVQSVIAGGVSVFEIGNVANQALGKQSNLLCRVWSNPCKDLVLDIGEEPEP